MIDDFKPHNAFCNGFVRVLADAGPDTLRLDVEHYDGARVILALSPAECAELADMLTQYVNSAR